jgi:hypothetical protein
VTTHSKGKYQQYKKPAGWNVTKKQATAGEKHRDEIVTWLAIKAGVQDSTGCA